MVPAEREFARMLARSTIGDELRAIERAVRRLVRDDVFGPRTEDEKRRLERLAADAGGRALYAFVEPFAAAVATFAGEHPDVLVQHDCPPAPSTPPRAGEWIRSGDGDGLWHLFGGDLRLRVRQRASSTFAEARCRRLIPVSTPGGAAVLDRALEPAASATCRTCRRADHRARRRAARPTG